MGANLVASAMQLVHQLVVGVDVRHKVGGRHRALVRIGQREEVLVEGKVGHRHRAVEGDRHKLGTRQKLD